MQAIQRIPSARAAQHDPTSGSQTVQAHSMRICELHCPPKASAAHPFKSARQTAPRAAQDNTCCRWFNARSKRITALHSSPLGRLAHRCPLVDTSNTWISAAAQAPAGSSRWFSVLHQLFRVDLDHSAPRRRTSSVIMMVPLAPARRDHLALTGSACTPPAGSCTAARQWGEQKRSIAQRRSAFSAAPHCEARLRAP